MPAICCDHAPAPGFPALPAEEPSENNPFLDARLAPFAEFCIGCHANEDDVPPNFLRGTDSEVLLRMKTLAGAIYDRLAWESDGPNPMPPRNSAEGKRLRLPENDSIRQEMIVTIRGL